MKSLYLNANAQTYFKEVALYIFVKQMCKSSKNCQIPFGSMEMYINEWQKKSWQWGSSVSNVAIITVLVPNNPRSQYLLYTNNICKLKIFLCKIANDHL